MMDARRERLIDDYLQGRATPAEIREIDALVRSDERFRSSLALAADDETALEWLGGHRGPVGGGMTVGRGVHGGLLVAAAGLLAAAAAGGWLWLAGRSPRPAGCQVVETRGSVLLLARGPGAESTPLAAGDTIPAEGRVWTGPWAAVAVRLADGTRLQIDRASEATLKRGDRPRVELLRGSAFVTRDRGVGGHATLTTPQASIEVGHGLAAVIVDADRTIVEVAAGETTLTQPDGGTTRMAAGQVAVVERGDGGAVRVRQGRLEWQLPDDAAGAGPVAPGS